MSEERAEYKAGTKLIPYLSQMRFTDDTRKCISVKFGLYQKNKSPKTKEWWSGKVSVEKLFKGLQKAGLVTRERMTK